MPDLAQRFLCNLEFDGNRPTNHAYVPKQVASIDELRPIRPDASLRVAIAAIALAAAIASAVILGSYAFRNSQPNQQVIEAINFKALVERIIQVESTGIANKKNKLSSATGPGQFLDDTWLEAVRKHRRDLTNGRSDQELLKLRRDAELTREIITRLVEQYAKTLQKRALPLTPGSLYLAYFAGPAGAVALLTSAEKADAASLMAAADVSGRTTRQKLVRANPFLEVLTVGDLKNWADHKMRGI